MAGEVSFFELGVDDADKAREFYGELFGWQFEASESGRGYGISTPDVPGGVHGGDPGASPYVFLRVEDLDEAAGKVRELGGEADALEGESEESQQKFGRFLLCKDDQGSSFGLHEPPSGE